MSRGLLNGSGLFFQSLKKIFQKSFAFSQNIHTFAVPKSKWEAKLRYGVMVALQILALSVRVRVLLSQQHYDISHGGIAQLVRAHDS